MTFDKLLWRITVPLAVVVHASCGPLDTPTGPLGTEQAAVLQEGGGGVGSQSGGDEAVRPDAAPNDSVMPPGRALKSLAQFTTPFQGSPLVNATIGPEGGSLRLGDFEMVVPAGAVPGNTLFMIRRPRDLVGRDIVIAELLPHNVTFDVPITVRFPYAGTTLEGDPEAAVVIWDGSNWLELPTVVIEGGQRLEAQTTHLSFWGISLDGVGFAELSSGGE